MIAIECYHDGNYRIERMDCFSSILIDCSFGGSAPDHDLVRASSRRIRSRPETLGALDLIVSIDLRNNRGEMHSDEYAPHLDQLGLLSRDQTCYQQSFAVLVEPHQRPVYA